MTKFSNKILCVLFLSFAHAQAQVPLNGLIGGWPFNGNANDMSGTGNDGAVFGASLVADRFNNPNCAYQFDGIDDYIVMLSAGPTGSVSRSVSFWAKTTKNTIEVAFNYGEAASPGGIYQIVLNYNCQGVGFDNSQCAFIKGGSFINDDSWHHIAAVYDASQGSQVMNVKIYIDAVLQQNVLCSVSGTVGTIASNAIHPITIGRSANSMVRMFKGALDDFYFYDRPLTLSEVTGLYNGCKNNENSGKSIPCVNVPDYAGEINVTLFPNPCQNTLALGPNDLVKRVMIYSPIGKRLKSFTSGFNEMDVSDLAPGVYIIVVVFEGTKSYPIRIAKL